MARGIRLGLGCGLAAIGFVAAVADAQEASDFRPVGSVLVQAFTRESGDWFQAAEICAKQGARLCRPAEWVAACRWKLFDWSGQPEWVDQLAPWEGGSRGGELAALAMRPCEQGVWAYPYKEYFPIRCCRER